MGITTSTATSILYDTGTGQQVRQEGTATGQTEVVVTASAAGEELAIKGRQPELIDTPPFGDTFATPVRQVGSVDVVIVSAPAQAAAVNPGTGSGVPVRTTLDDMTEGTPSRLMTSLGLGSLGEGAPAHLGTVGYPVSVRGADTAGSSQQLALDHTRADDYHAVRITNGTTFIEETTGPAPTAAALPVRQVGYGSGRPIYHVVSYNIALSTTPGTTKSLLAMTNGSLSTIRIVSIGLQNAQFTNIAGTIGLFAARRVAGAVTGGAAATVFVGSRKSSYPDLDVGITWITGGTLPGSPVTLAARRLSTDDVTTAATDTTVHQFGYATFEDIFRFHDDPVEVFAGEIVDVHLTVGAAISAGQFDVHFILET